MWLSDDLYKTQGNRYIERCILSFHHLTTICQTNVHDYKDNDFCIKSQAIMSWLRRQCSFKHEKVQM
jgi:hypothetical protein